MANETVSLQAETVTHSVVLEDLTLFADGFTLQEERPYDHLRMWNGNWYPIALGQKPCKLKLQCRVPSSLRDSLLSLLRKALQNKTAYSFILADTAFSDMKLTAFTLQAEDGAVFCRAELSFFGTAADPASA